MVEQHTESEAPPRSATFRIDPEALAVRGRSLTILLLQRRCASCRDTLALEATGGLQIPVKAHLERIARHCSSDPDFVRPRLPLLEAIFRLLLTREDQTMTQDEVIQALRERWASATSPRVPPPEEIRRIVAADTFYGIITGE